MTSKKDIRDAIFAENNKGKTKTFEIFGQKIEMRQPRVGDLLKEKDPKEAQEIFITILLEHCYVPGTNERVFEDTDKDSIMALPAGEWTRAVNDTFAELAGINIEEAEKNLDSTQSKPQS